MHDPFVVELDPEAVRVDRRQLVADSVLVLLGEGAVVDLRATRARLVLRRLTGVTAP